jgi:hypothetical protein
MPVRPTGICPSRSARPEPALKARAASADTTSITLTDTAISARELFALNCRHLALTRGALDERAATRERVGGDFDGNVKLARCYEDGLMRIVADPTSLALSVYAKDPSNPVVSIMANGEIVRNHGQQAELFAHVAGLIAGANASPERPERYVGIGIPGSREQILDAIRSFGDQCCAYNPGPDTWLTGTCDCKYGGPTPPSFNEALGRVIHSTSEKTGCPELRTLYHVVSGMSDEAFAAFALL